MKKFDAKIITTSLIDWLDVKFKDKTIAREVSVNTSFGTKVVDVMISNGHTIAYEIKSELDTTKRLYEQVEGFKEIFEYVYVVYWGTKFSLDELNLSSNIGAIEVYSENDLIKFKLVKKAKINTIASQLTVAKMLWKSELEYFLSSKQIQTKSTFDKLRLVNLFISNFSKQEAKKIFRFVMKKRFERGYIAYKNLKHTTEAIQALLQYKTDQNYLFKL